VTTPGDNATAKVDPGPSDFAVGQDGSTITGKLYRYVTWRDENCPTNLCDGTQNTKRVIVAVSLDPVATSSVQRAPLWFSTVITDPSAAPPGYTGTAGGNPSGNGRPSAQIFYLYDHPCADKDWDDFAYSAPSGSHNTRNTAQTGPSPSANSTCDNSDSTKQPDMMGVDPPPGNSSTPIYQYSEDLAGDYLGGLAMMRKGTSTCRTSYSSSQASDPTVPNKWAVHAWTTPEFDSGFHLSGRATLSFYTETVGGVSGRGLLCATLIERHVTGGVPSDTTVGSTTYDVSAWPASPRRLSFTFTVSPAVDIDKDNQLVLVLHLRGESAQDVALLYDHPLYQSVLELETTTPIGG